MQSDEFVKLVSVRAEVHSKEETENVIKAVFETLRDRIVHDTGDNIRAQLPHDLQKLWESGIVDHVAHRIAGPTRMDLSGFIGRVSDRLGTNDFTKSEMATRAVFTTLRQAITPGAQESVEKELPEDIRKLWRSSEPPEMPEESAASRRRAEHVSQGEYVQEAEQEGPPYEMEAPVVPTPEEQAGTGPWRGAATCEACGVTASSEDMELTEPTQGKQEIHTEEGWHHREVGAGGQPLETEKEITMEHMHGKGEHEVHPPAEERVDVVPAPGTYDATAGPGSVTHYRTDPQLEQEIRQMLEESDEVEAEKIDVFVQAGNVTLRGHVKDHQERDMVGRIAAKALGVGEILNEVSIGETHTHEGEMHEGEGI